MHVNVLLFFLPQNYFRDTWNIFDFITVLGSITEIIVDLQVSSCRHTDTPWRCLDLLTKDNSNINLRHKSQASKNFSLQVSPGATLPASQMQPKSPWDDFRHLCFTSCLSLFLSTAPTLPLLLPHPPTLWLGCPSRWTPSTWASWSFSERLAWSSCWGRATPSVSCCGPSYNLSRCSSLSSRSEILTQACRELVRTDAEIILTASNQWRLLLSPPTGSSLRLSPHRDAFLHIRHHWHAGTFPLKNHNWHDGATLRSNVNGF